MNEKKTFYTLIAGSLLSAVLAGSCCLAPFLFLVFGVSMSSLSFLQIFAPYQNYFIFFSMISILYLWYDYFKRKRRSAICTDRLCSHYLHYLLIGSVIVPVLITYPYWATYILE
ncbi:mercuric transporter MerT family protein [Sulfurovum sp. ST-21]|uniref:Mercuric transport protein MerT n=1 Tax=Sulfurovum indicum TaxID=2779528 RepID=A0A7M1S1I7_9BACT|nr:mercuric transporter MerT family protein [Sulfurovum indicum]QOR61248.1 hypothetical protein IMZ28_07245 [Sulfurovum indicum]